MKRLSICGVVGIVGSAFLLTGACGGSSFTAADGSGGLAGSGVGKSGADGSGDSQSSAGESGSSDASGSGGLISGGAAGSTSTAGASGSRNTAGSGGVTGTGGVVGSGGVIGLAGAAGHVGSAGSGTSGSAGAGGNSCVTGTVTFKMLPAMGSAASAFCSQGCSGNWLTVTDANSKTVVLDRACNVADCKTCASTACPPIVCINQPIPSEGLSRPWDETQWNPSVCGMASSACSIDQCVPAGKYRAKMCAVKNTTPSAGYCTAGDSPVCTTVDFVLPGATTVQGTIGG
jgi:hypothetical protein